MNFNIGLSALRASQFAIDTVSQNLANANTEGYHRQRVGFATRVPQFIGGQYLGAGVEISRVERIRGQVIEASFTNSVSDLKNIQLTGSIDSQIETLFLPGDGSIHQALGGLFDELGRLSTNPSEKVQRSAVLTQAVVLTKQTQTISQRLTNLKKDVKSQIDVEVQTLNDNIVELVALQNRIITNSANGATPNDLYDQRDQLVNRIAETIDVQRFESTQGGLGLTIGNSSISLGNVPVAFKAVYGSDGQVEIQMASTDRQIKFASGTLPALTETYNHTIDQYQSRINEFASQLIRSVDQAHATGVGIDGPYNVLRSARSIGSTTRPLNQAGTEFPVTSGDLFFSITDPAGEKRTVSITIDPATDSLTDIANRISSLGTIQAVVDDQSGQLAIVAQPGYRFDFTGNLETKPILTNFTGSSIPGVTGQYTGQLNRKLSVAVIGSGSVGKTDGLLAQVTDNSTGKVIAEVNIGNGYEAGSKLEISDGISLTFSGGEVVAGDQFTTDIIANSDTTGLLSAIGMNNFFSGKDASDIEVSKRIINNPNQLATSRSGDIADTLNLAGMIGLRDKSVVGADQLTFEDYLSETTTEIGFRVRTSKLVEANIEELNNQYRNEIASISGVDPNEELVSLQQYQKQYEAAVKVMQTVDDMLTELFNLIR